jgi:hypothetical protein
MASHDDNMVRTQISFEPEEYEAARRVAAARGISLAELCRRGLREAVGREGIRAGRTRAPWMRHAGALASGDALASETVDAVVYGRAQP